jgi:hypothetical protein
MEKFRTDQGTKIEKFEVVKETPQRVTYKKEYRSWVNDIIEIKEVTENKNTNWASWHDSFEEARKYLLDIQRSRIEDYKRQIEYCNKQIDKILELVEN